MIGRPRPMSELERDLRAVLTTMSYLAGRDSPHHTRASRASWRWLYERDMERLHRPPIDEVERKDTP